MGRHPARTDGRATPLLFLHRSTDTPLRNHGITNACGEQGPSRVHSVGLALATVPFAAAGMGRVASFIPKIGDVLGTSSHCLQSLVHVVASICLVADEVLDD